MRRLMAILALGAACGLAGAAAERAEATVLTGPLGVTAGEDVAEQVHCRPGRRHHRARPYDGCYRALRRAPVIVQPAPPPPQGPSRGMWEGFGSLHEW